MSGKEQKQKSFTRESWLTLKCNFNKNTMKNKKSFLRLCLLSDMQNAWQQYLFLLKNSPEAYQGTPKNKCMGFLLYLILWKKLSLKGRYLPMILITINDSWIFISTFIPLLMVFVQLPKVFHLSWQLLCSSGVLVSNKKLLKFINIDAFRFYVLLLSQKVRSRGRDRLASL